MKQVDESVTLMFAIQLAIAHPYMCHPLHPSIDKSQDMAMLEERTKWTEVIDEPYLCTILCPAATW